MKRIYFTVGVLSATLALTACGQKTDAAQAPAAASQPAMTASPTAAMPAAPAAADNMAGMNMAPGAKMAKGAGTVTAVDAKAGTITVSHGPIAEANWPAMTMGFKAAPALVQSVKAGDKVAFDLKLDNGSGEITAIQKQ